ncbi:DUF881 domain-containing protein [Angustibacter peucedani]
MSGSPTTAPERRKDASMQLLVEVMTRPLDPGYAAAAERRRREGTTGEAGAHGRSVLAVVALLVVGLLLGTAWWQARGTRPAGVQARDQLAAEISRQDAAAGALQRSIASLTAQIEAERTRQLQLSAQGGLADEVANLGLATGALSVAGPGITVTLDDADGSSAGDGSDPRSQQDVDNGRVLDSDLQLVVNGLWDAGAEAVAVNGQRLTALSAIRSAGEAVLVDYRPLSPPYRVTAIGDPATLQTRFSDGPGGRDVQYLKDNFGVRYDVRSASRLVLPASAGLDTRRAKALQATTSTSTGTSTRTKKPSSSPSTRPQETP